MFFPRTKILAPPLYTVYINLLYIYQLSLVPPKFLYVADPMGYAEQRWFSKVLYNTDVVEFCTNEHAPQAFSSRKIQYPKALDCLKKLLSNFS